MWLSVLATQKFRFPLLPQSDFHGDPRVPGGCPRRVPQRVTGWPLDLPGRGLSQAEFAGWRSRFRLGLEKEETAGWRQRRCAAKQDDAGNASTAPDQAGWLRRPRVHSAPPSTNARVQVPDGRGPQRRGSGWPWGASGSAGLRRAAAARSARLDAKAGGAAKLRRTDCAARAATAGGPAPGRGSGNDAVPPAFLEEEPPPVGSFSLFSGENQSPRPRHLVPGWGSGTRAAGERLSKCRHFMSVLIYQTTSG